MNMISNEGTVLQMQDFSVHDGEGIRTVIFLPGCPLRCKWCANPETWTIDPKLAFYESKCISCGTCRIECPKGIFPAEGKIKDPNCTACGKCVEKCPEDALKILCKSLTVHEIVEKIKRQEIFFRHSNGGVTFSGGEPTFQHSFLRALVQNLDDCGIDMWIETCGFFQWDMVKNIFEHFSHVFFDLKVMDPVKHFEFTGCDNQVILQNAIKIHELGIKMTIRIPSIKEVNFTEENITETAKFVKEYLPGSDIELLPYHNLGNEKYKALKIHEFLHEYTAPSKKELEDFEVLINSLGVKTISYK